MNRTVINFNVYNYQGPCNVCGKIGDVGDLHKFRMIKTSQKPLHKTECGGTYQQVCAKHQGGAVKKYRQALKAAKIKFTETMFINCPYNFYFQFDFVYKPGQMIVVFTWE